MKKVSYGKLFLVAGIAFIGSSSFSMKRSLSTGSFVPNKRRRVEGQEIVKLTNKEIDQKEAERYRTLALGMLTGNLPKDTSYTDSSYVGLLPLVVKKSNKRRYLLQELSNVSQEEIESYFNDKYNPSIEGKSFVSLGSIKNLVEEGKFPIRRTAIGYFKEVKYTNKGGCPLQGPVFVLHSY